MSDSVNVAATRNELRKEPNDVTVLSDSYSNFDCEVPKDAEEKLRTGSFAVEHPAWDHWGCMWFADGKFHERVMVYHSHVATVSGDTLKEVFSEVNDQFGWE